MTDRPPRRGPGYYKRLAQEDAARRGMSPEEYGVYKGSEGSLVTPVNSAGGLLIISVVLTVIGVGVIILMGVIIAQSAGVLPAAPDSTPLSTVMWVVMIGYFVFPVWSWVYYAKERRAQKVRVSKGLPRTLV